MPNSSELEALIALVDEVPRGNDAAEIRVESIEAFVAELERHYGPLVRDPKLDPSASYFMGIRVIETEVMPPGFFAITRNGDVQHIGRYRALSERQQEREG